MYFEVTPDLAERLRSPDVTDADVLEYLWGQHDGLRDNGLPSPPVSAFFVENRDLNIYKEAAAWWPTQERHPDMPNTLVMTDLRRLCFRYEFAALGTTFYDRLMDHSNRVVSWLQSQGISTDNPNESKADRKARLNREAQARYRQRKGEAGSEAQQAHAQLIKTAWDAWQGAIGERDALMGQLDKEVDDQQRAYHAVCARRKAERARLDKHVAELRAAYVQTKNTPPSES